MARAERNSAERLAPGWGIWLVVLLLAGLVTRGWEVDTSFDHPDEPITTGMHRWLENSWDTNWRLAGLPPEFSYDQYNFSSYLISAHWWAKLTAWAHPQPWVEERAQVLVLRTFSVLCGALAIVWAWLVGERLHSRAVGLVGALLVMVHPQLVADAHYARPEAMLTWLALVAVWLAAGNGRPLLRVALVSALVGFMTAAKVTLLPLAVLAVWPAWRTWRAGGTGREFAISAAVGAAALVAGFAVGVPGALAQPAAFLHGVKYLATQYGGGHPPHNLPDGGRIGGMMLDFYIAVSGVGVMVLAVWGLVVAVRQRRWSLLWLLALPAVLGIGHFAFQRVFFERNLSHVLPFGLLLAGVGVAGLVGAWDVSSRWRKTALATALAVTAAWPSIEVSRLLVVNALSGREYASAERWGAAMKEEARRRKVERRVIGLTLSDDLERLRRDFGEARRPLAVTFSEFDDLGSRQRREAIEREFVTYLISVHETSLSRRVPISALRVYHGARTVELGIVGVKPPPYLTDTSVQPVQSQ